MKIGQLKLLAYGPFTGRILDFCGNGYGLHVIFGPNEAGKSTALRALIGFLYGFGHRVEDAWLHANKNLCVGGLITLPDGSRLNLTRHKRRKNDLIDEDTHEPIDQAALDHCLGRMGRETFAHAFGISHDSLRQGVESILAAGGDLGQALFAAGSGLNTLKKVIERLENQQSLLFAPRAQKAQINAGISELNQLRKEQREASASHLQWKKMKKALDDLKQCEIAAAEQIEALSAQINLLSRHREALKHVASWDQLQNELARIGWAPDLPADFTEKRFQTQVALNQARQAEEHLLRELTQIDQKMAASACDQQVIARETVIKALAAEAHVHAKAMADSQSLRDQVAYLRESAQKMLERLRPGITLDAAEALRLSKPEHKQIQRLGADGVKLHESGKSAYQSVQSLEANLLKLQAQYERLAVPVNTAQVEAVLAEAAEQGPLESRLSQARADEKLLSDQIDHDVSALGLWTGERSALEGLPIPPDETMRRFENQLAELDRELSQLQNEQARTCDQLKEKEDTLAELTRVGQLPSLEDLEAHRRLRDRGWHSVRAAWLQGLDVDREFMEVFPDCGHLAEAYEKSVDQADRTADTLRAEAEIIAQAEALRKDKQACKDHLAVVQTRCDALIDDRRALWEQWIALWAPAGIVALMPREMAAWAGRVEEIKRKAADLRRMRVTVDGLQNDLDRLRASLAAVLAQSGIDVPENIGFSALVDLARRSVQSAQKLTEERRSLETRMATLREEIASNRQRIREIDHHLRTWSAQWDRAVKRLGFETQSAPHEVHDFILALEEVFALLDKAADIHRRILAITQDYEAYTRRVADAVAAIAPDLEGLDAETAALQLNARLIEHIGRYKEYQLHDSEKRQKQKAISDLKEKAAALAEALQVMCEQARAQTPDQLPEIEKQAAARLKWQDDLHKISERLSELACGQDVSGFIEQVRAHDPDELAARQDRLAAEQQSLYEEQKTLVADMALARKELEAIGGQSRAAAIALQAEGLAGKLASDVEYYMRLRLASAVLAKSIERYRQGNQSPVLEAAAELFASITRQAFSGLRADYNEQGEPVIKAIRPDGALLNIKEMSDGSRDQLFLALRLGALKKYVHNNGPMPFIVDDVLVHFDDDRSAAALNAMAGLAEKTQILFFTHHRHLVELARVCVPETILHVHRLEAHDREPQPN